MKIVTLALVTLTLAASAVAFAAPGDPQRRHTAADVAQARGIVLRAADLRGWRPSPVPTPTGSLRCRSFVPDLSALVETGRAASPEFNRGRLTVGSNAIVLRTRADASAAWRAVASAKLLTCITEAFRSTPGIHLKRIVNTALPFPRLAPQTAAFRSSFVLTGFGDPTPVHASYDFVFLGRGRVVALLGAGCDGGTFPPALERRLAALLAQRLPR